MFSLLSVTLLICGMESIGNSTSLMVVGTEHPHVVYLLCKIHKMMLLRVIYLLLAIMNYLVS